MNLLSKDLAITLFFVIICLILWFVPTGFEGAASPEAIHAKAIVVSIENSDLQRFGIIQVGTQFLKVKLLNGPHNGQTIKAVNQLMGKMELDEIYRENEKVLIEYRYNKADTIGYTRGHYRLGLELILIILFASFLVLIAGWTGIKALLSFIFAGLMIWKVMIPMFLEGTNPLPVAILTVAALTASVSFLVGGLTRKGIVTLIGSFSGLLLACILANVFSSGFKIHGAVKPYSETLLYSGFPNLNLTKIFICGVFIACSGAVMDIAMDIAASMQEIIEKKPDINVREHILSGLRVGRAVVGTMTTTLLLAYSGGYTTMLMYYMAQGIPLCQFFNLNIIAAEVLNILVGSFGLIMVAPFSAFAGGIIFNFRKKAGNTVSKPE